MKKKIIVTLEVDSEDEFMLTDDFIRNDIETEINCASNYYNVISINVSDVS